MVSKHCSHQPFEAKAILTGGRLQSFHQAAKYHVIQALWGGKLCPN
jgi:hypothetical protein